MSLHIIKLCVGAEDVEDLRTWQTARLKEKKKNKEKPVLVHVTRMTPTRADEILDGGGSLYWVMKGFIRCRQRLIDIEPFVDGEGIKRCKFVLDPEIVLTRRRERRPFQGWRYFDGKDAPADVKNAAEADEDMPEDMRAELEALGLL